MYMRDNKFWLYSSLEDLIDMDINYSEIEEEYVNDSINTTPFSDGAPKSSTEHAE